MSDGGSDSGGGGEKQEGYDGRGRKQGICEKVKRGPHRKTARRRWVFGVGVPRSINYLKRTGNQETETHARRMDTRLRNTGQTMLNKLPERRQRGN